MPETNGKDDSRSGDSDLHPMEELLASSASDRRFQRGDVVEGTIVLVGSHEVLIDVGAKTEGILAPREFGQMSQDELEALSVGDNVKCLVINPEDRSGNLVLSLAQARLGQDWAEAEQLDEEDELFEVSISGHNKGGLIAYVGEVRGFIPASQIDRQHGIDRSRVDGSPDSPLARMVGEEVWVKVIEVDRRKNRLILSEQAAMRERRKQSKAELLGTLREDQILSGVVTSLADFGAFVDIGGADGLVHLSELSWSRVNHPQDVLSLGDEVTVKVISVDRERNRIGLSLKQLTPEPWSDVEERFELGGVTSGEITRLTEYGAFAKLDGDVEGLIHVTELSDESLPPAEVVTVGDEASLRVIHIDPSRKRIGLSLKRAGPEFDDQMTPEALAEIQQALDREEAEENRDADGDSDSTMDESDAHAQGSNDGDEEDEEVAEERRPDSDGLEDEAEESE